MFLYRAAIIFLFLLEMNCDDECVTPNNETGKCVPINSCAVLLAAFNSSQNDALEFARRSLCGNTNQTVCCGTLSNYAPPSFQKLFRTKKFCGKQHSDDYFHTINETKINEFPWMVALVYRDEFDSGVMFRCGGSLLNNRYVLTAAQCVYRRTRPLSVRLGEYHIKNDTDCVEDADIYECSEDVEEVGIENIIMHPDYHAKTKVNDIALIRLNKKVLYSDYIRPICLPLPGFASANVNDVVVTSGWGRTDPFTFVNLKTSTHYRLISKDECQRLCDDAKANFTVTEDHLCTVYLKNNTQTLCNGDGGASVMFPHRNRWHQVGIISAASRDCSTNIPVINTKVVNYLKWIEDNIEN